MNILFLSQSIVKLNVGGIYSDLINGLILRGHKVCLICADAAVEKTCLDKQEGKDGNYVETVWLKVENQFGVSFVKKGLIMLGLERKMKKAIKKTYGNRHFDLVLYATPPITLVRAIGYCKKKFGCKSYLMLKDIFPQNAVDIGLMRKSGLSGMLYRYFRGKEKKLYRISDKIGCMSKANVAYVLKKNPEIPQSKVEIFPNARTVEPAILPKNRDVLRAYNVSPQKTVFIYGGNLGKPQGMDYLVAGIKAVQNKSAHFILVGTGSEQKKTFEALKDCPSVTAIEKLPFEAYEALCRNCDVGLVMLDHRFTIPNYPSRSLSYLAAAMPILACTDSASDIKELVCDEAECGKWVHSNHVEGFVQAVNEFCENKPQREQMGQNGRAYLLKHFHTDVCLNKIENFIETAVKEINHV